MLNDKLIKSIHPDWCISTICGELGVLLSNIGQPHKCLSVSYVKLLNKKRNQQK